MAMVGEKVFMRKRSEISWQSSMGGGGLWKE